MATRARAQHTATLRKAPFSCRSSRASVHKALCVYVCVFFPPFVLCFLVFIECIRFFGSIFETRSPTSVRDVPRKKTL